MKMVRQRIVSYEEEIPESLEKFKSWEFSTGGITGEDFKAFSRLFKKFIKGSIPANSELVGFSSGHYDVSGFVQRGNRFIYFSISDVRFFKNKWATEILIRTAENEKDYTGGVNGYTALESFREDVSKLLG
ncbi:hypothetical protein ES703_31964 [subsurface metagenome]